MKKLWDLKKSSVTWSWKNKGMASSWKSHTPFSLVKWPITPNKSAGSVCLNLTTFSDLVYRVLRRVARKAADLEAHRVGQKKKVLWQKLEVYLVATKECSFAWLVGKAFYTYLVLYVLWSCWFVCYLNQHDTKGKNCWSM